MNRKIVANDTEKILEVKKLKNKIKIMICPDEEKSLCLLNDAKTLFSHALYFPAKDIFFYNSDIAGSELMEERLKVIENIFTCEDLFIVTTMEAAIERINSFSSINEMSIDVKLGKIMKMSSFIGELSNAGYERYSRVDEKGQFSVRGSIIDIFSYTMKNPVRIEFFDDEVDSIREFDIESQRSIKNMESINIFIANDDKKSADAISLLELSLREDVDLIVDDMQLVLESISKWRELYLDNDENYVDIKKAEIIIESKADLYVDEFGIDNVDPEVAKTKNIQPYNGNLYAMIEDIKEWLKNKYVINLYIASKSRAERMVEEFVHEGVAATIDAPNIEKGIVNIKIGALQNSFIQEAEKNIYISDTDIFKKHTARRKQRKFGDDVEEIQSFSDLKIGDIVVHEKYGIGIYRGIEKLEVNGVNKDFLAIEYKKGSLLHVLATNITTIQKYIGNTENVAISDLNTDRWAKSKQRVRSNLEVIAKDLVELYAKRQSADGFRFSNDSELQKEMEEMFEFIETNDQLLAIEDVKSDMESPKVMDRLICGDVGFGKTEIAIRAAFKAVLDNKQVVVLVPTTILARQHFNVFSERLKMFPVNIRMLSRFVSPKETTNIIDEVNTGKCDILIGTQAVLKKAIKFKDLGLLIVDEEQRFGVKHKDKIKGIKNNIDVLTLSATPIPRTLHMSLSGIRDLSLLNEPPYDRQPVQTYVLQYREDLIKEAILREIHRGGQVYYLHNRVDNIEEEAEKLRKLLPNIDIGVVHGQLSKRRIEEVFNEFNERIIDVLVATTIVETGLDIPNVNTIIINNADKFGLSTLYQLRGRVGRSSRKAYAFLTYPKGKQLSSVSAERLKAIREFTKLGSGSQIAMRDMQIRGTGSILGSVQHGHIESIGYELYCKILKETLAELNGDIVRETFETTVDLDINAHISNQYIQTESEKLEIYKKINTISSKEDMADIIDECNDRFGDIPEEVMNVIKISYIKNLANKVGIISIKEKEGKVEIRFGENVNIDSKKFAEILADNPLKFRYKQGFNKYLECRFKNTLKELFDFIDSLAK